MKQFLKNNLHRFIISSLAILAPVLVGVILWDKLSYGFGSWGDTGSEFRVFGVIILPLVLLVLHWVALLITGSDKRNAKQSKSIIAFPFFIIPCLSIFSGTVYFALMLGMSFSVNIIACLFVGLGFIIIGNYMPKTRLNFTLGIKLRWTLASEENWYATHRFAGKLWTVTGFLILPCALLPVVPSMIALISLILASVVTVAVYSYINYQRLVKLGRAKADPEIRIIDKKGGIATAVIVSVLVVALSIIMFTGRVFIEQDDDGFYVDSTYGERIQVKYGDIDSVELRSELKVGVRFHGFNSARLNVGLFQNDEFGIYTIYAYTGADEYLIIKKENTVLCIALRGDDTAQLYDQIVQKTGK